MYRLERLELNGMKYIAYFPDKFDETKKYPLLMFLHGAGERYNLDQVKTFGPLHEVELGKDIQAIILAPFCENPNTWFDYGERLKDLVDLYRNKSFVDIDRVSVTGLSMGGYGTWHFGMSHPDWLSAIAPLCGGGYVWNAFMLKNVKVWAFHGDKDSCVDIGESDRLVNKLKELGVDVKYTVYKGFDHDVWSVTYANDGFYDWILNCKRYKGD